MPTDSDSLAPSPIGFKHDRRRSQPIDTDRRRSRKRLRSIPTAISQRATRARQRSADLRASLLFARPEPPPWDRELSLALDRWILSMEGSR